MSNKIVTSIYNVIDNNIEQINDTRIICIDIAKGFVGIHKYDPIYTLDVSGTINCQKLYINNVLITPTIVNYSALNKNIIPLNDNIINLGIATKYWLNAYIYNLSAESINVTTKLEPVTHYSISLGSTSKYWGKAYICDLSAESIDVSVNLNPLVHRSGSLGISDRMWRNAYIRDLSVVSIDVSVNCNPLTHRTGSLGSTTKYWNIAYIRDLSIGSIDVSVNLNPLTNGTGSLGISGRIWGNAYIRDLSAASIDISVNCNPLTNGTGSLGSTTKYWSNAFIQDLSVTYINTFFDVNTLLNANTISYENIIIDIVPKNATESLGLSNKKWGNAYIRDLSVGSVDISVNLNMKNNSITNIHTLTADVSNYNITTTARIYQNICGDISWNAVNGYYGLRKDAYPSSFSSLNGKAAINLSWKNRNTARDTWFSICWSPELEKFVAVGERENQSACCTSSNGITWTPNFSATHRLWRAVCWSPELTIFVAVSLNGYIMTSNNGETWFERFFQGNWYDICWSKELGIFVVIQERGNQIATSSDGENWLLTPSPSITGISWSPQLGLFVIVGGSAILTSRNGKDWNTVPSENPEVNLFAVCWSPKLMLFAAIGGGFASNGDTTLKRLVTSSDGITWTPRSIPLNDTWKVITWSPQLEIFIIINDGAGKVVYSSDGINWYTLSGASNRGWDICWSTELGIFVTAEVHNIYTSSLKGRPPTSYNVFDSSFNAIDESGNWTFSKITTPSANIIDLSGVNSINGLTGIGGFTWTNLVTRINNKYAELFS